MPNKITINLKILDWWISWLEDDYKIFMLLDINGELTLISRLLKDS